MSTIAPTKKKAAKKPADKKKTAKAAGPKADKVAKAKQAAEEKEALNKQQLKNFKLMQTLAEESDEFQRQYDQLKNQAKDIKGAISKNNVEIRRLLLANNEKMPLFDRPAKKGKKGEAKGSTPAPTNGQVIGHANAVAAADPDAWRKFKIRDSLVKHGSAAFTRGINSLEKAEIETIGQLEDRRAKLANGDWHEGIEGLGPDGAEEILNAHLEFLSRTRDAKAFEAAKNGEAK